MRRQAKEADYYDDAYSSISEYRAHYKTSQYYVLWTQVLRYIMRVDNPSILEIGCGTGQLAQYLWDEGYRDYHGFDFSTQAVQIARENCSLPFSVGDARLPEAYEYDYKVAVAVEVLEHVDDDLAVVDNIRDGAYFVFSLPTFDHAAHVRYFTNARQIRKRYYRSIELVAIAPIGRWFACFGVIRRTEPKWLNRLLKTRQQVTPGLLARGLLSRLHRLMHGLRQPSSFL